MNCERSDIYVEDRSSRTLGCQVSLRRVPGTLGTKAFDLLPPAELRGLVGVTDSPAEFLEVGRAIAGMLQHFDLLAPGIRFLDVGCGCGRAALQMLESPISKYEGFDRNPDLIRWASSGISALDSRFSFRHVSVASAYDDEDGFVGAVPAEEFAFPYADGEFDVALLASVFTHMNAKSTRRYLDELARVVAPGGKVLASWYLTSAAGEIVQGLGFHHPRDGQGAAVSEAGFTAHAITPVPFEGPGSENRAPLHEWFLLTRR